VPKRFSHSPEFRRLLEGDESPCLLRIALEIAHDAYPDLRIDNYIAKVDSIAQRIRARCPSGSGIRKVLNQINWALFVEDGFEGNGDDYFDPRNSYLNDVIDRKTGIPISLSILYKALADRLGVVVDGVNLPAHFMLRIVENGQPIFIDAFHAGDFLDQGACEQRLSRLTKQTIKLTHVQTEPSSARDVVTRMLRNLKRIYFASHDFQSALLVQQRLALVALAYPEERRDLGVVYMHLDRPGAAIDPLQSYLDVHPKPVDAEMVSEILASARSMIAQQN
jgi:regulator of sirC expression with transglutaminase-like and TPR domain